MSDRILLQDMVFYGYHGAYEAERELGQRFEVDVEMHLDLMAAGRNDDIEETVNYVDVYTVVKDLVEEQEFRLIESLAEAIARQLLAAYDLNEVVVRVRKPHVPIGGLIRTVEVEIRRTPDSIGSVTGEELSS